MCTQEELHRRYPHAAESVDALRSHPNVREVVHGVDCRELAAHFGADARFDRIVFNLPQAPVIQGARNKIQRHRALLSEFCASASTALARNGQLWITLLAGQGGTCLDPLTRPVGDTWQIVHAGADAGLLLRAATHVSVDSLGYEPTGRRANQRLTPSRLRHGLLVHVFSRENEPEEPAVCGAIEWHFQNSFQTDSAAVGDDAQPAGEAMLEIARGALGSPMQRTLVCAPTFLRARHLDQGGKVLTYRFTYRSAELALSLSRVRLANSIACEAIAQAGWSLRWTLGYPVRDRS